MSVRIATFNVENLMNRFDYSGFNNVLHKDRALALFEIKNEDEFKSLERARTIAHTDDNRQLTALAIAGAHADILCLQEVDNLAALEAFEYGYLFKMIGRGYTTKYTSSGNDTRGIDVAIMMRDQTQDGEKIEFIRAVSHARVTFQELGLHTDELRELGFEPHDPIFRRDCFEVDVRIGGKPLTLYIVHFKSMGPGRNGTNGRDATMPVRIAEAKAVRQIIERRFGLQSASRRRWIICGDLNDYRERVLIKGEAWSSYSFEAVNEDMSSLNHLLDDGFAINLVERRDVLDRWTLYHTRGPDERHLCQLDYLLASPQLAEINPEAIPDIIRKGQPWRTIFPASQEVERFPRVGWDRPKASDHCPVVVSLELK